MTFKHLLKTYTCIVIVTDTRADNFVTRLHVIFSDPGSSGTEENESEEEEDRSEEDWSPDSPLSTREQPSVIVSRIRGTDNEEF